MKLTANFYLNTGSIINGTMDIGNEDKDFLERWSMIKIRRCLNDPKTYPLIIFGNACIKSKDVVGFSLEKKRSSNATKKEGNTTTGNKNG